MNIELIVKVVGKDIETLLSALDEIKRQVKELQVVGSDGSDKGNYEFCVRNTKEKIWCE